MYYCDVCGERLETVVWYEEAWGKPVRCEEAQDCKNPYCGNEEEE